MPDLPKGVTALPNQQCRNIADHDEHDWTDYEITRFVFHCDGSPPPHA